MTFTQKVRFVVRRSGQGFCDITGSPVEKPVVYLVPLDYFQTVVRPNLTAGLTIHSFDDFFGQHYAVRCELRSNANGVLRTGNPTNW